MESELGKELGNSLMPEDPHLKEAILSIEKAGEIKALAQIVIDMVKPFMSEYSYQSTIERLTDHLMDVKGKKESDFETSAEFDNARHEAWARAEEIERIYVELERQA